MSSIKKILIHNREFVQNKNCQKYTATKFPRMRIAILTCMDTRLVELLPAALGIKNGDVLMLKSAGARITGPFDNILRSLLIGITELGVEEIIVIGHTNCGAAEINAQKIKAALLKRGVSQTYIDSAPIDFNTWLSGFDSVEDSVRNTVDSLLKHPLMPKEVCITGYVIDIETGKLTSIE